MKKLLLLKSVLLLCALIVGSVSGWAEIYTIGWGAATGDNFKNFTEASGSVTGILTFSTAKNSSQNAPAYNSNNSDLRLYYASNGSGGSITITPASGITITGAVINATNNYTPSVKYTVDSGTATAVSVSSNSYTVSGISATSSLTFQNVNTSNTQLRIKTIQITYTATASSPLSSIALSGDYPTVFSVGDNFSHEGMTVTATYEDNNTSDVTSSATFSGYNMNTAGNQTVTVSYTAGQITQTAEYGITVNNVAVTGITLDKTTTGVKVGRTVTLTPTIAPNNATNKNITWSTSNSSVATVDNGEVTGVAGGTATITATTEDGDFSASCTVTVTDGSIDLTAGTISFTAFTNAGSYNQDAEADFSVTGSDDVVYDFTKFYCMVYSNTDSRLQMHAGDGYLVLPTIKSAQGFTFTVTYSTNANATSQPSIVVGGTTVATGASGTMSYTTDATSAMVKIMNSGSHAVYVSDITIAPTKDDRSLSFSNPTTTVTVGQNVTNAATASPAGTIVYTSSDEDVATVDTNGKVTGVTIGTATITATVAEDASYNEATASYNITVNGIPAATSISLTVKNSSEETISKDEIPVGEIGTLVAGYTKAEGANVTVTYDSSDATVLEIDDDTYDAKKGGTATVTVTVTPNDVTRYSVVEETFDVTVLNSQKGTTELTIVNNEAEEVTSGSTVYGTNITLTAVLATDYDGTIAIEQTNEAIADVAISDDIITITPKAAGSTTITLTAPETANFDGEVSKTYTLTVTAPSGQATADIVAAIDILNETFDGTDYSGGNDGTFRGSFTTGTIVYDGNSWTVTNTTGAKKCLKVGTSSGGSATTPSLALSADKIYTISFRVAGWTGDGTNLTLSATQGTLSATSITMTSGAWTEHSVTLTGAGSGTTIKFQPAKRCFLDDVWVGVPASAPSIPQVTIASSGYGTYCCEYPLDFSTENNEYKAYTVSNVSGSTVTFSKINGIVKGGVPVILYGTPGNYNLTVASSSNNVPTNMLKGTLAPTYVETIEGDYTNFGLSGGEFKKISDGVIKANKAYLPVLTSALSNNARLSIIFDDNETTGITDNKRETTTNNREYFNLAGQRIAIPAKGLYIVNGHKVVIK
ncbi:MAG: Ig domain-containing protein [Prevotella sp.]|nr:Ig domain-containing protein [Prevotella sp.]